MKDQRLEAGTGGLGHPSRRSSAVELGLRFYSTGKPCRYGHLARRYASTGGCVVCVASKQSARDGKLKEAQELLRMGKLTKASAKNLGSPFYCTGEMLSCRHVAWQRVIDDKCKMCLDREQAEIDQLLA